MRKTVFLFVGKKKDLQAKLAAMTGQNVIHICNCSLCSRRGCKFPAPAN
jgi:hypothetical protein